MKLKSKKYWLNQLFFIALSEEVRVLCAYKTDILVGAFQRNYSIGGSYEKKFDCDYFSSNIEGWLRSPFGINLNLSYI